MLNNIFKGLFDSDIVSVISVTDFILCITFSLALGLLVALTYMYRTRYTKTRKVAYIGAILYAFSIREMSSLG